MAQAGIALGLWPVGLERMDGWMGGSNFSAKGAFYPRLGPKPQEDIHTPQGLKARPIARPHAASHTRISPGINRTLRDAPIRSSIDACFACVTVNLHL